MRPRTTVAPAAASISVPAATRFYTSCVVSNRYESAILNIGSSCGWSSVVLGKHVAGHNHMSGATPPTFAAGAHPETNPEVTIVARPGKSFRRISLILTSLTTDATRAGTVLHHRTDLSSTRPAECPRSATVASKATSLGAARSVLCFTAFCALVMSSCVDGLLTEARPGGPAIPIQFAIENAANISTGEENAINNVFDLLDQLRIRVTRPGASDPFIDTIAVVEPGQDSYEVEISVPLEESSVDMQVDMIGSVGSIELFSAAVEVTISGLNADNTAADSTATESDNTTGTVVITLPIRYTGPDLRGLILDPDGAPAPRVRDRSLPGCGFLPDCYDRRQRRVLLHQSGSGRLCRPSAHRRRYRVVSV